MGVSKEQYAIAVLIAAILTNLPNISTPKNYGHYRVMSPGTSKIAVLPAVSAPSDAHFKHLLWKNAGLQRQNQFISMKIYVVAVAFVAPVARKKLLR